MRVSQFLEKIPFGSDRRKTQIQNTYLNDPRLSREELEALFENNTKYLTNRRLTFEDVFRDRKRREEEEEIEEFEDEEEVDEIEDFEEEEERELEDEIVDDDKEFQASSYQFLNALSLAHQSIRQDDPELARLIRIKMKSIIQPIVSSAVDHVSLTERVMQLYPNHKLTQKELFDIGKEAKALYVNRYLSLPMQKMSVFDGKEKLVNYYTRDHLEVIDQAINKIIKF